MDFTPLQTWLHLPAGSWPPTHYVLLNLQPGTSDPAKIEQHVMERMDVLRRHQLRHPELVTAGMNQLAQALICLSDEKERTAYDAQLGLTHPPSGDAIPAGIELDDPAESEPVAIVDPLDEPIVEAVAARAPTSKRWAARRRAVIRRCLRSWDQIALAIAIPEQRLDRPAARYLFLRATESLQPLLPEIRGVLEDQHVDAELLLRVLLEADSATHLRRLAPEARTTLAVQWRRGRTALESQMHQLRRERARPHTHCGRSFARRIARTVDQIPELVLILFLALALAISWVRSSARP